MSVTKIAEISGVSKADETKMSDGEENSGSIERIYGKGDCLLKFLNKRK